MSHPAHHLGRRAEGATAAWLTSRGWTILDHRWRSPLGELDLVCLDPEATLVGVEVKLRSTGRAGSGAEGVDRRRVGRLRQALAGYAASIRHPHRATRLDLVSLEPDGHGRWRLRLLRGIDGW
ncbi:MAG: YraN family protein [Candidatus Limnocylindria bacterium]